MRKLIFLFIGWLMALSLWGQEPAGNLSLEEQQVAATADSLAKVAALMQQDSLFLQKWQSYKTTWEYNFRGNSSTQILENHPYYAFAGKKQTLVENLVELKKFQGKEVYFYVICGLFLFFAILRRVFAKYVADVLSVYFKTTLKFRQIREQILQNQLASLLFNLFFIISTGLYLSFLLSFYQIKLHSNFWLQAGYLAAGLLAVYTCKFIILKLVGWLISIKEVTEAYIFIVFQTNKFIGLWTLLSLPLLAFTKGDILELSVFISWIVIVLMLLYRFLSGYMLLRELKQFSVFHFVLYIVGLEIAPLFLIYRILLLRF